ncbi:hypothetical protein, partial [Methylobacterium soli]|uniref:hypothetical protein n=1 Tax=Methylobacterium soli TaxID=553447 RepID=UPI001EE29577
LDTSTRAASGLLGGADVGCHGRGNVRFREALSSRGKPKGGSMPISYEGYIGSAERRAALVRHSAEPM